MIGALKEYLNYKLVGTKTYGKGIAQTQLTLSDSSVLKYTNAKWLTPNGNNINGEGFKPDYEVNDEEALLNLISKIVKEYAQKM